MQKKQKALLFTSIIMTLACIVCGIFLYRALKTEKEEEDFDDSLMEFVAAAQAPMPKNDDTIEDAYIYPLSLEIDFDALRALNSEVVGWLYQADTNINYPVVQTTNNSAYLKKRFDSSNTEYGTLFVDFRNDVFDSNSIIIYGHNTSRRTLTMFSSLIFYVESEDYIEEHPSFEFYDAETGEGYIFDVFAVVKPDVTTKAHQDEYYRDVPDDEYADYIEFLKAKSLYETGIEPSTEGKLLILSIFSVVRTSYEVWQSVFVGLCNESFDNETGPSQPRKHAPPWLELRIFHAHDA